LEQRPQFREVVLEGCTSEKEPTERPKHEQNVPPLGFEVLDHMSLVKYHIIPSLAFEDVGIPTRKGIRCDADIEVVLIVPALPKFFSSLRAAMVAQCSETR
jgi:hypothetical protein